MVESEFSIDRLTTEPNQVQLFFQACSEALNKESKPIVLFGSGGIGIYYLEYLRAMDVTTEIYFCDNSPAKWGTTIQGVRVISFDELKTTFRNSYIIICSIDYYDEIRLQLKENHLGCMLNPEVHNVLADTGNAFEPFQNYVSLIQENLSQFQKSYQLMYDDLSKQLFYDRINYYISASSKYLTPLKSKTPQYFASDIIKLSDEEVFVDGGAFTGDTVEEFLKQTNGNFKKIYAFEPEENKHKEFRETTKGYDNIQLMPFGLWSKQDVLRFNSQGNMHSFIDESGSIEIPVVSIDDVLAGEQVTFIKMDIEGAEFEALKGAELTIKKYKPKLAICVYHKPLDLVDIPLYLKELVPEYKFFLRHYNNGQSETVCYAVAE